MEVERTVTVSNKYGLHARASTALVKTAAQYDSDVRLVTGAFFDQEEAAGQRGWGTHDECLARHDSDALARVIYDEFLKKGFSPDSGGNGATADGDN